MTGHLISAQTGLANAVDGPAPASVSGAEPFGGGILANVTGAESFRGSILADVSPAETFGSGSSAKGTSGECVVMRE